MGMFSEEDETIEFEGVEPFGDASTKMEKDINQRVMKKATKNLL